VKKVVWQGGRSRTRGQFGRVLASQGGVDRRVGRVQEPRRDLVGYDLGATQGSARSDLVNYRVQGATLETREVEERTA
jgi:hypothetical protein